MAKYEAKTAITGQSVEDFLLSKTDSEQKLEDCRSLISLMTKVTGQEPKMWGASIVGFGEYHYKYASGHEGNAPLLGFSPGKAKISLYVFTGEEEHLSALENLGKFKMGKACIYIKKLSDIDLQVLENVMKMNIKFLKETYG